MLGCYVDIVWFFFVMDVLWECWCMLCVLGVFGNFGLLYVNVVMCDLFKFEVIWEIEYGCSCIVIDINCVIVMCVSWYQVLLWQFVYYDFFVLFCMQVVFFVVEEYWFKIVVGCVMDMYYCWMEVVIGVMLVGVLVVSLLLGFIVDGLLLGLQVIVLLWLEFVLLQFVVVWYEVFVFVCVVLLLLG